MGCEFSGVRGENRPMLNRCIKKARMESVLHLKLAEFSDLESPKHANGPRDFGGHAVGLDCEERVTL
jgi:hypothetical protein